MTTRPDCWPYQFKKVDGVWHRRQAPAERWERLNIERRKLPPEVANRKRGENRIVQTGMGLNKWVWK